MVKAITESLIETSATSKSEKEVLWEPGDEIAVFSGELSGKFVSTLKKKPSASAVFKGELGLESWPEEMDIWAVYPYSEDAFFDGKTITTTLPSEQIARDGAFGKDMNLAIAHSNSSTLQFYNVGGGIRFSVAEEGIKKVMFEGLNGEIISGKVKIGFDKDGLPEIQEITRGSQFITLLPPDGQETFQKDTWYYIVAIPGSLEKGYKLRFYKDTDYARNIYEKVVTIKRNVYRDLEKVDEGIEYEPQTMRFPETKEEWEESDQIALDVSERINSILAIYGDSGNNRDNTQDVVEQIQLLDDVISVAFNEISNGLCIQLKDYSWLNFVYELPGYNDLEGEYEDDLPNTNQVKYSNRVTKASSSIITPGKNKALVVAPYHSRGVDGNFSTGFISVDFNYIETQLNTIGYEMVPLKNKEFTISDLTGDKLKQYGLIIFSTHGIYSYKSSGGQVYQTAIDTGVSYDDTDDLPQREQLARIALGNKGKNLHYYITDSWLKGTTTNLSDNSFNNTIICMSVCESYRLSDLAEFFLQHGAGGYCGNYYQTARQFNKPIIKSLVHSLCSGMSFPEAVNYVESDPLVTETFAHDWIIDHVWPLSLHGDTNNDNPEVYLVNPYPKNLNAQVKNGSITFSWEQNKTAGSYSFDVYVGTKKVITTYNQLYCSISTDMVGVGTHEWSVVANLYQGSDVLASYRVVGEPITVEEGIHYETPQAVDLGLSVKWASFNLGATKKEEYGYYYAWGETEPKGYYYWDSYIWCEGDYNTLTKYCTNSANGYHGFVDGKLVLETEDDAAYVNLGEKWRMPTEDEWKELHENCSWTWTTEFGEGGYKAVSKKNGNYVFFPLGGYYYTTSLIGQGTAGYYWSSCLPPGSIPEVTTSYSVYTPIFGEDKMIWNFGQHRYAGQTIRPVSPTPASRVTLDRTEIRGFVGDHLVLYITTTPENASHSYICSSNNKSVATIPLYTQEICFVECHSPGVATVTVTAYDGGAKASCRIIVEDKPIISASPTELNYGNVKVGQYLGNEAGRVEFTNTGGLDLSISSIDCPDGFSHSPSLTFPIVISPGNSKTITFAFKPTEVKTYSGYIEVYSNAPDGLCMVRVTGNGVE